MYLKKMDLYGNTQKKKVEIKVQFIKVKRANLSIDPFTY